MSKNGFLVNDTIKYITDMHISDGDLITEKEKEIELPIFYQGM